MDILFEMITSKSILSSLIHGYRVAIVDKNNLNENGMNLPLGIEYFSTPKQ